MHVDIDLSGYDDAPVGALGTGNRINFRPAASDPEGVARVVRAGGLDGVGGLHEWIRWTCIVATRDGHGKDPAVAKWSARLGPHRAPHVHFKNGRIESVTFHEPGWVPA